MMMSTETPATLDELTANLTGWWASRDGEFYTVGSEASREAAISAATEEELGLGDGNCASFTVALCTAAQVRLSAMFRADRFLEECEDQADDYQFEGEPSPFFEVTKEQEADLEARVRAALDEWQVAHQLRFVSTAFVRVEHREQVTVPLSESAAPTEPTT
jgi:hypothetical protein